MNMKIFYWFVFSLFFSVSVSAAELVEAGIIKTKIAKNYNVLKAKTDMGEKVRVIARIKDVKKSQPRAKTVPQGFLQARNTLEQRGLKAQREFPRLGLLVFEVDSYALDSLINSDLVEAIQEDIPVPPNLVQSINQIDADLAHNDGFTGANQAVVIIDTGVEFWHPFFANRLVEEACFSSNTTVATSLCPNGQEIQTGANSANDCSPTGITGCDHGTHVAGIAAGINQNMKGVSPSANIVAIQVFSEFPATFPPCDGVRCILSYTTDQLDALEWVLNNSTTNNIAAINMSLGGGSYTSACDTDIRADTIAALRSAGIATVISSGNDGASNSVGAPGCISSAITVGSTLDSSDTISSFSNSASMVDILAPGSSITSSVVGGNYGTKWGTSMAAPHVTGAFAVMRAVNQVATVEDIEQSLENKGVPILDPRNNLTFPRLDLYTSVISFEGVPIAYSAFRIKSGVTGGKTFLSVPGHGEFADLWYEIDTSGRQLWSIELTNDGYSYNIIVSDGISNTRRYLSTNGDGTRVDLWNVDDGSGRQRWIFSGENIIIKSGVSGSRKYLSTTGNGSKVDLWSVDDNSGRQKWVRTSP